MTALQAYQAVDALGNDDVQRQRSLQSTTLQKFQSQLEAMKIQEMAEIRKALKSISALILQQGAALEALAEKKKFPF